MLARRTFNYPTEIIVRVGMIIIVPDVLRELGLQPEKVLAECGLDLALFNDAENTISLSARDQLIAHCAATAKCEHFGLMIGKQGGLQSFGLIGLLARHSPDVHTALHNLQRYFKLFAQQSAVILSVQGDSATLSYQSYGSGSAAHRQICDGALAILFNTLRQLCGPTWAPTSIQFNHSEPQDSKALRNFFGRSTRFHFNADISALIFESSWLAKPLPDAQEDAYRILDKQILSMASRGRDDFPEQVRNVMHAALLHGDAKADRVAALFGLHPRTLNRRLNQFGINYQGMLDGLRFELAQQMLQESEVSTADLALMLNYADTRAFIRAFRRWSGETPAQWRAARKPRYGTPVD